MRNRIDSIIAKIWLTAEKIRKLNIQYDSNNVINRIYESVGPQVSGLGDGIFIISIGFLRVIHVSFNLFGVDRVQYLERIADSWESRQTTFKLWQGFAMLQYVLIVLILSKEVRLGLVISSWIDHWNKDPSRPIYNLVNVPNNICWVLPSTEQL